MPETTMQPSHDPAGPAHTRGQGAFWTVFSMGTILVIASLLRLGSAQGDLWIDEIWSLDNVAIAMALPTLWDKMSLLLDVNTHPLNSLYLALIGPHAEPMAYRALSVVSGVATVAAAAIAGRRRSIQESVIAAILVAFSYPMVHYSGEARGYAPLLCAALFAFVLLERYLARTSHWTAAAFIAVTLIGLSTHLTFVAVLASLGLWAALALYRRLQSLVTTLARLTVLFGLQLVIVQAFALILMGRMSYSGTDPLSPIRALEHLILMSVGVNIYDNVPVVLAFGLTALLIFGLAVLIWRLHRQADTAWIFYLSITLVFPAVLIGFWVFFYDPLFAKVGFSLQPRFFLVSALFALMLWARGLSMLINRAGWRRATAVALLLLFVAGNTGLFAALFGAGRGAYAKALKNMTATTSGRVTVTGSHDYRVPRVLDYYARALRLEDRITYVKRTAAEQPADWHILESYDTGHRFPAIIQRHGAAYSRTVLYRHWGPSGSSWAIFHRDE